MKLKEPISAMSNITYAVAGVFLFVKLAAGLYFVPISLMLLSIGSAWYHSKGRGAGQSADEIAMYTVLLSILALGFHSYLSMELIAVWALWLAVSLAFGVYHYTVFDSFKWVPYLSIAGLLFMVLGGDWEPALIAALVLGASVGIRTIGERILGDEKNIIGQILHSVWHSGTAFSLAYAAYHIAL